ncbi:MAG: ABC transporter permease [Anaerolineaceae bacterium]|nr:ABC transporter permease [Anaerolineaceae bacterium]
MQLTNPPEQPKRRTFQLNPIFSSPLVPILAIFTALVVSSIALLASGVNPITAYIALGEGAFGSQDAIILTLIKATPYIIAGLGVALGFRGGLFNIGIEGQLFVGSIMAVVAGTAFHLPAIIHIPLTLFAGFVGGAIWAGIPGFLKARTGASEVITTIMANYIALDIIAWMIGATGPLRAPLSIVPQTRSIFPTAQLPMLIPGTRLHAGIVLAILITGLVYWLLFHTTIGFEIRTVGANPDAARYAGINVEWNIVRTMAISGGLAGLAGAVQVMGLAPFYFTTGFNVGSGFDSLAVAVLGGSHPIGVFFSALLFGAMNAGAPIMQLRARIPSDIITILQGLILMFVAADPIIRAIYRVRRPAQVINEDSGSTEKIGEKV